MDSMDKDNKNQGKTDSKPNVPMSLKPEFQGHKIRRRPYPAPKDQADEIDRQIQESVTTPACP